MNVRKFFGSTTREALSKVRDALGTDALILSNRQYEGGVEIMAVADGEVQALTYDNQANYGAKPQQQPAQRSPQQPAITPETIAAILHRRQQPVAAPGPGQNMRAPQFERINTKKPADMPPPPPPRPTPAAIADVYGYAEPMDDDEDLQAYEPPPPRRRRASPQQAQPQQARPQQRQAAAPSMDFAVPPPPYEASPQQSRYETSRYEAQGYELPYESRREEMQSSQMQPSVSLASDPTVQQMAQEIRYMRNLLEGQLSGFAWGELARKEPLKAELLRSLLGSGFSAQLSRRLLDSLPKGMDHEKGLHWLKAALALNLRAVNAGADFVERGGVHALVGPTGVGKTTTLAKLAARAVLKYGAEHVALITTDSYRIGAHEQLRIYGRILNVPVHAVKDAAELELTLADLHRSHLVLIDTVGMSQRDRRIAEQIELLCGHGSRIRRHLLLPATAQSVTLDDIVRAYRGVGMDGAILTKIDESLSLAPAVDCLIRHRLDVHYVTNGQKVPEDLHLANARFLVDAAFNNQNVTSAHGLKEDEWSVAVQWGNEMTAKRQESRVG